MRKEAQKHTTIDTGLREGDIRPPEIFGRFHELSRQDAERYFADPARRVRVDCPACGCEENAAHHEKQGFCYNRCPRCATLFVSPRPDAALLADYFATSGAARYRADQFVPSGARARRFHLVGSFAQWVRRIADGYGNPRAKRHADLFTVSPLVLEELLDLAYFSEICAVAPNPLAKGAIEALGVAVRTGGDPAPEDLGTVSYCETFERSWSPLADLQMAGELLAERGLFFASTRCASGFDLQILGAKAPYIFIPEHLNLISEEGFGALAERAGFEILELSTPGQLDVQFLIEAVKSDPSIELPPFIHTLIRQRGELAHQDFQHFLQKHRLSSYARLALRRLPTARRT